MGEGVDRADWACVPLGELFELKYGKGLPKDSRVSGDVPVYGSNGLVGSHNAAVSLSPCVLVGRKGAAGKVHYSCVPCWPIDTTYFIDEFHGLEAKFFFYLMRALQLNKLETSTAIPGLNRDDAYREAVPLPPLVEQRAIVAKIEALFSELDKGVEQLETVKGQLKRYRQSVLKAAFEGKLTAVWRAERARPFVQNSEQLKVAETPETYGTKNPEGWTFVRTGQLTEFVTSGSRGWSKYCGSTGALFIRSQDINRDKLALESVTRVNPPGGAEGNRTRVKKGDLLLTITGANVGKCACVDREIPDAYVSQHVALLRLQDTVLDSYLHWVFLSDAFVRGQLHRVAYGAGKPGLNLENVKDALIPLAPLPEQRQIVAEIESRFSALDQLEQTVETGLRQAEALRQSILKKAFEGRLLSASERAAVRADPDYEPAARLLERIRGERRSEVGGRMSEVRGRRSERKGGST
jgi:type I restriction enzyme S subunit